MVDFSVTYVLNDFKGKFQCSFYCRPLLSKIIFTEFVGFSHISVKTCSTCLNFG